MTLQAFKVVVTLGAKVVNCIGSALCNLGANGALTVKDTKGICLESFLAGVTKLTLALSEVVDKGASVIGTAVRTADGVYMKLYILDTKLLNKCICQGNYG